MKVYIKNKNEKQNIKEQNLLVRRNKIYLFVFL